MFFVNVVREFLGMSKRRLYLAGARQITRAG